MTSEADETSETSEHGMASVSHLPMARIHTRRINPVTITPAVQITIVIAVMLVLMTIVGSLSGA
jgi:hypothetical protein